LHIERPMLTIDGKLAGNRDDHRKVDDAQLFASFFCQVTEGNMSEEELKAYRNVVQELLNNQSETLV